MFLATILLAVSLWAFAFRAPEVEVLRCFTVRLWRAGNGVSR